MLSDFCYLFLKQCPLSGFWADVQRELVHSKVWSSCQQESSPWLSGFVPPRGGELMRETTQAHPARVPPAESKLKQAGKRDGMRGARPAHKPVVFSQVLISAFEMCQLNLSVSLKPSLACEDSGSINESAFIGGCLCSLS